MVPHLVLAFLVVLFVTSAGDAQVAFKIPFISIDSVFIGGSDPTDTMNLVFDRTYFDTLWFGYHTLATICRDTLSGFTTHWTLSDTGLLIEDLVRNEFSNDIRFGVSDPYKQNCFTDGSKADIRQYIGPGQRDSLRLRFTPVPDPQLFCREVYKWPSVLSQYFDSCRIRNVGGPSLNVEMTQEHMVNGMLFNASQTFQHSFRIVMSGPKIPPPPASTVVLKTPVNEAVAQSTDLDLTWNAASGALLYRIQLSTGDPNFGGTNIVLDDTVDAETTTMSVSSLTHLTTYYWRVAVFTEGGVSYFQNPPYRFTTQGTDDVRERSDQVPPGFKLHQSFPNPFNPTTEIRYELPEAGFVSLKVFDILGREVAALVEGRQSAGTKSVNFVAGEFPSGVYYYKIVARDFVEVRKMILMR